MGARFNMTRKEYALHRAYFVGCFKAYVAKSKELDAKTWWRMVCGWCNIIEMRYGNFDRDWFLSSIREEIGALPGSYKDLGLNDLSVEQLKAITEER